MNTYTFKVRMPCSGCSNATDAYLKTIPDFRNIKVYLETQTVEVDSNLPLEQAYELVKKSGRTVEIV
jgi:copper chaperone CopZ